MTASLSLIHRNTLPIEFDCRRSSAKSSPLEVNVLSSCLTSTDESVLFVHDTPPAGGGEGSDHSQSVDARGCSERSLPSLTIDSNHLLLILLLLGPSAVVTAPLISVCFFQPCISLLYIFLLFNYFLSCFFSCFFLSLQPSLVSSWRCPAKVFHMPSLRAIISIPRCFVVY